MKLETFFEKFDVFADAPDAIAKMRELVLDLAIQGKLVEHRASEGDGHTLLKKLRTLPPERNSKSRSPKDIPVEPETLLEVPSHWALTTVENTTRDTGFFCDGDWVESKDQDPDGEVRLIQLADVGDGQYRDRSSRFMTKEAAKRLNCSYLQAGDILVARMPDPLGRCCRFPGDTKPAVTVVDVCILRSNISFFDPDFLVVAINCPRFRRLVLEQATGTTRSRISRSNLGVLPIPLPPIAEQKRIVAKVDELMVLCDKLETQQQKRETRHSALARASLARFADAPTLANLNFIFHKSYDIAPADLRKSILTLAVQGKLASQDPNDEPASELFKRIQSEQAQQNTEGLYKSSMALPPIREDEKPFPLPLGWEWFRLRSLVFTLGDGLHGTPEYSEGTNFYFINGNNLVDGRIIIKPSTKSVSVDEMQKHKKVMTSNTVLVSINGTLGSVAFYNDEKVVLGKSACYFNLSSLVEKYFVRRVIESPYFVNYALENATGTTIRNLGLKAMNYFPFPLPPLAEQRRIVAKVDELMALVDALETQLATSRITAERLMEAVVAELTDQRLTWILRCPHQSLLPESM